MTTAICVDNNDTSFTDYIALKIAFRLLVLLSVPPHTIIQLEKKINDSITSYA